MSYKNIWKNNIGEVFYENRENVSETERSKKYCLYRFMVINLNYKVLNLSVDYFCRHLFYLLKIVTKKDIQINIKKKHIL